MKKIGVVLAGCGYLDGAEISEAVSTLLALSKLGAEAVCLAPDMDQHHVVNHITGEEVQETRNVLIESARIARGKVTNIKDASAKDLHALIFPGGFGAAKNLCDFALKGSDCEVHPEVQRLAQEMHQAGKPIGAICISPAMMAKIFEGDQIKLTIGNDEGTAEAIGKLGQAHVECPVDEICIDSDKRFVTAPAYMYNAKVKDVYAGIEKLVIEVIKMVG